MSITYRTNSGAGATASATSLAISPGVSVNVGDLIIIGYRINNGSGAPPTPTISDTLEPAASWTIAFNANLSNNSSYCIAWRKAGVSGSDTITVSFGVNARIDLVTALYSSPSIITFDQLIHTEAPDNTNANANSGNVTTTSPSEVLIGLGQNVSAFTTYTAGSGYTKRAESGTNPPTNDVLVLEDQNVSSIGTYAATATWGTPVQWGQALITFKDSTAPTNGTVALGTWSGPSFASVFSKSANPLSLDLMQVINEGGKIVYNLNANGVGTTNPLNSTSEVLLAQYFGPSLSAAFSNPLNYDLLQILGAGGAVVFHVNYLGVASTP